MEQNINQDIMDKLTKVCICKGIPRSKIKAAIRDGARTLQEIQRATGAGSGGCGGRRCTPKIEELLREYLENNK
jgi:NAD(P)H-nitrite reductase large subunit